MEAFPARERRGESTPPPRPRSSSLVCSDCRSGDTATGFSPDCRNISSMAESGIAGKDNESRTERWEAVKGWTSFIDLTPPTRSCNAKAHAVFSD